MMKILYLFIFFSLVSTHFIFAQVPLSYYNKCDALAEKFGKDLARKNKMIYLNQGVGAIVDSHNVAWDISLIQYNSITIEEAKPIAKNMICNFFELVEQEPVFAITLKDCVEKKGVSNKLGTSLIIERLGIQITFWDKDINRPLYPYIAKIKILEGKILYYYANPDQSLRDPLVTYLDSSIMN